MAESVDKSLQKLGVTLSKPALAAFFIAFSVLLLIFPTVAVYLVASFLLIQGLLLIIEYYQANHKTYILQSVPKPAKTLTPPPAPVTTATTSKLIKTTISPTTASPAKSSSPEPPKPSPEKPTSQTSQ